MTLRLAPWVLALGIALAAPVRAADPPPVTAPVLGGDRATIRQMHEADQTAIQMGKLARDKGSARAARDLGRVLIADGSRAEQELDKFLRTRGSDLSALGSATSADADHELLATKVGAEFDRAFALQAIHDAQTVLDRLSSARIETADDDLRAIYDDLTKLASAHKRAAEAVVAAQSSRGAERRVFSPLRPRDGFTAMAPVGNAAGAALRGVDEG